MKKRKLEKSEAGNEAEKVDEPGEAEVIVPSLDEQISEKHLLPVESKNDIQSKSFCQKCLKNYATVGSYRRHLQLFHKVSYVSSTFYAQILVQVFS